MEFTKLRKSKNITQEDLAKKIGISNRTVSMWECGNSTPKMKTIAKIAIALNVSKEEVIECFC